METFAQTKYLTKKNSITLHSCLKIFFLFGIALSFYYYNYSIPLIIIVSLLSMSAIKKKEDIKTYLPKETTLLLISIASTLIIIKITYFYNHLIVPTQLRDFNEFLQKYTLLSFLTFFALIFNTLLKSSLTQIKYTLIISSLPLLFKTVFMHNLDALNVMNPNPNALYFAILMSLAIQQIVYRNNDKLINLFLSLYLFLGFWALFLLNARQAWVSLCVSTAIVYFIKNKINILRFNKKNALVIISLIVISVFGYLTANKGSGSVYERLDIWQVSLMQAKKHFWFGNGWPTINYFFPYPHIVHSHNTYIYLLFAGGIFLLISCVIMVWLTCKDALKTKTLSLFYAPVLLILINGCFDHTIQDSQLKFLFFLLLACLHTDIKQLQSKENFQ